MDDEVVAADEVGLDLGQAAGEAGEEPVVEAPHPGAALAGDQACPCRSGSGTTFNSVVHVDDAEAGDEVAGQAAREDDVVAAGDRGRRAG